MFFITNKKKNQGFREFFLRSGPVPYRGVGDGTPGLLRLLFTFKIVQYNGYFVKYFFYKKKPSANAIKSLKIRLFNIIS